MKKSIENALRLKQEEENGKQLDRIEKKLDAIFKLVGGKAKAEPKAKTPADPETPTDPETPADPGEQADPVMQAPENKK